MPNTLVITLGGKPQIVTETVYGLMMRTPPWVPDEIIIATTSDFVETLRNPDPATTALCGPKGKLAELYASQGLPNPGDPRIISPTRDGRAVRDLREPEDVTAFAELLLQTLRRLTDDTTCNLHVSIAGGRKTMGAIVMQVMGLLGRLGDQLSHCLVEPAALEQDETFWWPRDPATERVDVHGIPFVRMRPFLKDVAEVLREGDGYDDTVRRANIALASDTLRIDIIARSVTVGSETVVISRPTELGTFLAFAAARQLGSRLSWTKRDDKRELQLDGSIDRWRRLYGFCQAITQFDDMERDGTPLEFGTPGFEKLARTSARRFDADRFASEQSRAKAAFKPWAKSVRERLVYSNGRLEKYAIGFDPDKIEIILPNGFDLSSYMNALL